MNVSLFVTCLIDQLRPSVAVASARLLSRLGCTVDFPASQTCCGQPAFNSGYPNQARVVARNMLRAFEGAEYVVSPSGSCAGMIHHYYSELFADDPPMLRKAQELADKTYELSQFVVGILSVTDVGASCRACVTYHPSCHGLRILGVRDEPLQLLRAVEGIDLVPLSRAQDCCGFGGTFAVKMSDVSGAMVREKAERIVQTGARYLVGTDTGCLLNISGKLERDGSDVQVLHLAEFLDRFQTNPSGEERSHAETGGRS